jgi:hypothetical protein
MDFSHVVRGFFHEHMWTLSAVMFSAFSFTFEDTNSCILRKMCLNVRNLMQLLLEIGPEFI